MTHILVTGAAGFIGSHTCRNLLRSGHQVTGLDDFNDFYSPAIKKMNISDLLNQSNFTLVTLDILDKKELKRLFKEANIQKICHLAARAGVRPSIQNPTLYQQVNVEGTLNILELCAEYNIQNLTLASSSSVYGKNSEIPFHEESPCNEPISPYAATKKAVEMLATAFHHIHKIPTTILRFFTVYGPSGRPDMAPFLFTKAISQGQAIKRFGDGSTARDYTFIDDIVNGIVSSLEANLAFEIINLGNNQPIKLNHLIEVIQSALGKKAIIEEIEDQPGDVPITFADITKAKKLLNYEPKVKIEEGIDHFVRWYKSHSHYY